MWLRHDDGGYHTMYRLRLDGRWGAFDARVLDWAEVGDDARIRANQTYKNRSAPFFEFFGTEWERAFLLHPKYFASEPGWIAAGRPAEYVFGNRMYELGTVYHDMDFTLPRGAVIDRFWDNSARKFYVPEGAHTKKEEAFLPAGRFYRVTETMFDGNWPRHDPNYRYARLYLTGVPASEGYNRNVAGGRMIGQAWGRITFAPRLDAKSAYEFASPFVLVDGAVEGDAAGVEVRTQRAKASSAAEKDVWSEWQALAAAGPRAFRGVCRFQLRGKPGTGFRMRLHFENGIMTLPRIFAGGNRIQCELRDPAQWNGALHITYRYQTTAAPHEHTQTLRRRDFRNSTATYTLNAPGLTRCISVSIGYE